MKRLSEAVEIKQRLIKLQQLNEMTAERDRAIIQRDQARREKQGLETQLRLMTNERDEARALGRCS